MARWLHRDELIDYRFPRCGTSQRIGARGAAALLSGRAAKVEPRDQDSGPEGDRGG